jgi:hypothetical protein
MYYWQFRSQRFVVFLSHSGLLTEHFRRKYKPTAAVSSTYTEVSCAVIWISNFTVKAIQISDPQAQKYHLFMLCTFSLPIPVITRSKAWVCCRSLTGTAGSNPATTMDVCLLWVLCVVRYRSPRPAEHSSRGSLPTVMYMSVIYRTWTLRRPWPTGL